MYSTFLPSMVSVEVPGNDAHPHNNAHPTSVWTNRPYLDAIMGIEAEALETADSALAKL